MDDSELDTLRRSGARLRREARAFRARAAAARDACDRACAESAAILDLAQSREVAASWALLLRKAAVYQRWCKAGRLSPLVARQVLAEDAQTLDFCGETARLVGLQVPERRTAVTALHLESTGGST